MTGVKRVMCLWIVSILCVASASSLAETNDDIKWTLDSLVYGAHGYSETLGHVQAGDIMVSERGNGDLRSIAVFSRHDGSWQFDFQNDHALVHSDPALNVPMQNMQLQMNPPLLSWQFSHDAVQETFAFRGMQGEGGTLMWVLDRYARTYEDGASWVLQSADDAGLLWQTETMGPAQDAPHVQMHEGALQDDLRWFVLHSFPKDDESLRTALVPIEDATMRQAKMDRTLTLVLTGDSVGGIFSDRKEPVYTGPNSNYMRAAGGKAQVSLSDMYILLGEENDHLLIQYQTDAEHMRTGFIPSDAYAYNRKLKPLAFAHVPATVQQACDMTDDPLMSKDPLVHVDAGQAISFLSLYRGEWAYVEAQLPSGERCRGFIQRENIAFDES